MVAIGLLRQAGDFRPAAELLSRNVEALQRDRLLERAGGPQVPAGVLDRDRKLRALLEMRGIGLPDL